MGNCCATLENRTDNLKSKHGLKMIAVKVIFNIYNTTADHEGQAETFSIS